MSIGRLANLLARVVTRLAAMALTGLVLLGQLGRSHELLDQINALLSWLVPLLALTFALSLRHRDRPTIAAAALGLAVGGWQLGTAAFENHRGGGAIAGRTIKVVTLSTFHANPNPAAIRRVILAEAPDIALLQETNGSAAPVIEALLPRFHRITSCHWQRCSLTILSRWPIRPLRLPEPPPGQVRLDMAVGDVGAPFGRFRVVNLHLPRPYKQEAGQARERLAQLVRGDIGGPLIVAGDFNTATGSFGLRRFALRSRLLRRDGLIPTYPAHRRIPAFTGIDHVFTNAFWISSGCRRTAAGSSDHHGVACRLSLLPDRS